MFFRSSWFLECCWLAPAPFLRGDVRRVPLHGDRLARRVLTSLQGVASDTGRINFSTFSLLGPSIKKIIANTWFSWSIFTSSPAACWKKIFWAKVLNKFIELCPSISLVIVLHRRCYLHGYAREGDVLRRIPVHQFHRLFNQGAHLCSRAGLLR